MTPDPLYVTALGRRRHVRHDDPELTEYSPTAQQIRSIADVATDEAGLRRYLETTVGERYAVQLAEGEIRLRRRD